MNAILESYLSFTDKSEITEEGFFQKIKDKFKKKQPKAETPKFLIEDTSERKKTLDEIIKYTLSLLSRFGSYLKTVDQNYLLADRETLLNDLKTTNMRKLYSTAKDDETSYEDFINMDTSRISVICFDVVEWNQQHKQYTTWEPSNYFFEALIIFLCDELQKKYPKFSFEIDGYKREYMIDVSF